MSDARAVIEKLDDLIERLRSPVSDDLLKAGWSEDSAAGIRTRLEAFRGEIDLFGVLPPLAQRPLGMVRALECPFVDWALSGPQLDPHELGFERTVLDPRGTSVLAKYTI